jgi:hypothetical protein
MLETSKDVLNIVLAISVGSFTFFLCWSLFYVAMSLRQVYRGFKSMKERFDRIDELIKALKEKIESSTSYLLLIGEGVKKLVEVMRDKRDDK